MNLYFPIVLDTEESGAISAFVPGLPIYAAADTQAAAKRAIRDLLRAYLDAHPETRPSAEVSVAQVSPAKSSATRLQTRRPRVVTLRGVGALLGSVTSPARAMASRENGRLGGRPKKGQRRGMSARRRPGPVRRK